MELTARQLAEVLQGDIVGNPDVVVNSLSKIEEGTARSVSFLANPVYTEYLYTTDASVVIVGRDFTPDKPLRKSCTLLKVDDVRTAFASLLRKYNEHKTHKSGIETPSFISPDASVGTGPYIGAFAYIGTGARLGNNVKIYPGVFVGDNAMIGDNTVLFSGVKVYQDCRIGADCTLHAGVVIGSDGFGFAPNRENHYQKVEHTGNVVIEDHVEIGANTTIDRATLGSTLIRRGVKLDNLIQIAHNVEIGENTVIAAQTGIAGSTKIGRNCMIGGQVGIVGHIVIADEVRIAAQSGVGANIEKKGETVQGSPAFPIGEYKRSYVVFRNLPLLKEKIDKLLREYKAVI